MTEIWLYIAADNEQAADRLDDQLKERMQRLAEFPNLGMRRPDLAPTARFSAVGNYIIFYRPIENGIEVLRVIHGARNIDALLNQELPEQT